LIFLIVIVSSRVDVVNSRHRHDKKILWHATEYKQLYLRYEVVFQLIETRINLRMTQEELAPGNATPPGLKADHINHPQTYS